MLIASTKALLLASTGFYRERCALHHSVLLTSTDAGMRAYASALGVFQMQERDTGMRVRPSVLLASTGVYCQVLRLGTLCAPLLTLIAIQEEEERCMLEERCYFLG